MTKQLREQEISFNVNGREVTVRVHPLKRLLDVLRDELRLTGSKEGCGEGECGACSVILDDELVQSCLVPACQLEGARVRTVEGLSSPGGKLHPVQEAFYDYGGAQCGICTPGMLMAGVYYLEHPESAENVREALSGNQCRCTGYIKIFDSVVAAFEKVKGSRPPTGNLLEE